MFIRQSKDSSELLDPVFKIAALAKKAKEEKGSEAIIDATIGSLYDENGEFVALKSVFDSFHELDNTTLGKYSSSFSGNPNYKEMIIKFVLEDRFKNLNYEVISSQGGSGAVFLTLSNILEKGEEILLPDIGWTSYDLMASEGQLKITHYKMFDGDKFNISDVKSKIKASLKKQGKALIIINSPAHNPTGYSLSNEEWLELVNFINNECDNLPVTIFNDVAYIDYCYDLLNNKNYYESIDKLNDNALFIIGYSISKSLTSYGMRLGAAIILHKDKKVLNTCFHAFEKSCRSVWSNSNNGAMENFSRLLTIHLDEYLKEKDYYIELLKERSNLFLKEAIEVNLPIYPFKEGFFITLKIEDEELLEKYHNALLDNDIYCIKVHQGIRLALCSLSLKKIHNLAFKMKNILDSL